MHIAKTIICLFFFTSFVRAQQIIRTFYDVKGKPLKEEFLLNSNNELNAEYTSFYQNGAIKSKGSFSKNIPSGKWSYYFESGKLRMVGIVVEGKNNGKWIYYYEFGGRKMEGFLVDNKRTGNWIIYSLSGTKKSEGKYHNNIRIGIWKYYTSSGKLKAIEDINDGYSMYTRYYTSGEIKSKGKKIKGKKEGDWVFYHKNGLRKADGAYKSNNKFGSWVYYDELETVKAEGNYIDNLTDGAWDYYDDSGIIKTTGNFHAGKKTGKWNFFYADGKLKGAVDYNLGSGIYKEYYKTGSLKVKGNIVNGKNQGVWKYFYESGDLEGKCDFKNGLGIFIGYYPPTTRKEIKNGLPGKRKMKGLIQDEKRIGIWELYERNGSLTGYYKPYYEGETKGFLLTYDKEEQRILSTKRRKTKKYYQNYRDYYFKHTLNENRSYIIDYNPISILYSIFPVGVEYYINKRFGYELILQYIHNPFFKGFLNFNNNKNYLHGFSASMRQKFYHKKANFGAPYLAHELRYTYLQYSTNSKNSVLGAIESKYEYAILVGFRYFKDKKNNKFTVDVFLGTGFGYRDFIETDQLSQYPNSFGSLNSNKFSLSLRAGFHLGYVLNAKKL